MKHTAIVVLLVVTASLLAGCQGGAVVFAPEPPALPVTAATYQHPSGAFTLDVPANWARSEQHATTLATAAFSPPGSHVPPLRIAAIKLQEIPENPAAISALLDEYQTQVRPDARRYTEASRSAMGDGSWRIAGLRQIAGGTTQQVNTFFGFDNQTLVVTEIIIDPDHLRTLEGVINSQAISDTNTLTPAALATLAQASGTQLEPLNVLTWTAHSGVFFITGEIANTSDQWLTEVPVRVVLFTADGRAITEARDQVMGYAVPPGGFAPFSLRFGEGQPALTERYALSFGAPDDASNPLRLDPAPAIYGSDVLSWTDDAQITTDGRLIIVGTITNITPDTFAYIPRVTVTVFDGFQRVAAAAYTDVEDVELAPGETTPYELVIPELGALPERYIVDVQAQP